jgi:DNA-binding transcriptional MerR regulator
LELISIGRFARQTGLSIGALRHYADLGLLVPTRVDPSTGYRSYSSEQSGPARLIAALRELDVPLAEVRSMLDATADERRRRLAAHRSRLEAEIWRLQGINHRLRMIVEHQEDAMSRPPAFTLDPEDERRLAAALFNHVWALLETPNRTAVQDDELLHAAHASRHHWGQVGKPVNWARGEWQCSRVYSVLGRSEPALHHARRCLELAEEHDLGPFDTGAAHEALARAHRVAGDPAACARHVALARALADQLTDPETQQILTADLDDLDELGVADGADAAGGSGDTAGSGIRG